MSYMEMIARALQGRSVNKAAKELGIPQKSLDTYAKGQRMPSYSVARKLADAAGISYEEAFKALAEQEELKAKTHAKVEQFSRSFNSLLRAAKRCWIRVPATA
jgi:transcriptional regulator with XRE-family HTH domain